jgi:hypothetical protein
MLRIGKTATRLQDGSEVVSPLFRAKTEEGKSYSASVRQDAVADASNLTIYLENPGGSGRTLYLVIAECVSTGQGDIDIYEGATSTGGTDIEPRNLNLGITTPSVANVTHSGTVNLSGANLVHQTVAPGGRLVRAVGSASEVGETIIIPETKNFLLIFTNRAGTTANMSVRLLWWEE